MDRQLQPPSSMMLLYNVVLYIRDCRDTPSKQEMSDCDRTKTSRLWPGISTLQIPMKRSKNVLEPWKMGGGGDKHEFVYLEKPETKLMCNNWKSQSQVLLSGISCCNILLTLWHPAKKLLIWLRCQLAISCMNTEAINQIQPVGNIILGMIHHWRPSHTFGKSSVC